MATIDPAPVLAVRKRGITRYAITETIRQLPVPATLPDDCVWVPLAEIDSITLSGPHRRWIGELLKIPRR